MPTLFSALAKKLDAACDTKFGELFEFRPMTPGAGGGRPAVDTNRAVRQVKGIFDDRSSVSKALGEVARRAMQADVRHIWLSIESLQFVADQAPKRADHFKRLDTGTVYEVAEATEDGEGRYKLRLHNGFKE